jgi:hypothetical protein
MDFPAGEEPEYTAFEKGCLERMDWFFKTNLDYHKIHSSKARTMGFLLHDSPIGLLAWISDKLFLWSDSYPWTPTELITWTLLHYFPGPTTGLHMYFDNRPKEGASAGTRTSQYLKTPSGYSAFPKEIGIVPRSWAERLGNVAWWREHASGGHFAAWERPDELAGDLSDFFHGVWVE